MSNKRDWYMCKKCFNQGWVLPNSSPDPNWAGGCDCEKIKGLTGPHNWEKLNLYQNAPTDLSKYPPNYFQIS